MGVRSIQLRRRGRCRSCRTELWPGDAAYFDDATRRLTCRACTRGDCPTLPFDGDEVTRLTEARRPPTAADRDRVQALIADARAALAASHRAS